MEIKKGRKNTLIINDSYNANETSTKAAIKVLSYLKRKEGGRAVAILGDMLELGKLTKISHENVGKFVVEKGVDLLITCGENAETISKEALDRGIAKDNIYHFVSNREVKENILNLIKSKDVVLVKASRAMTFDEIADFLTE